MPHIVPSHSPTTGVRCPRVVPTIKAIVRGKHGDFPSLAHLLQTSSDAPLMHQCPRSALKSTPRVIGLNPASKGLYLNRDPTLVGTTRGRQIRRVPLTVGQQSAGGEDSLRCVHTQDCLLGSLGTREPLRQSISLPSSSVRASLEHSARQSPQEACGKQSLASEMCVTCPKNANGSLLRKHVGSSPWRPRCV